MSNEINTHKGFIEMTNAFKINNDMMDRMRKKSEDSLKEEKDIRPFPALDPLVWMDEKDNSLTHDRSITYGFRNDIHLYTILTAPHMEGKHSLNIDLPGFRKETMFNNLKECKEHARVSFIHWCNYIGVTIQTGKEEERQEPK